MSDLMSGLDNLDAVFLGDDDDHCFQGGTFVRLSDVEGVVREALLNPTDEQVRQIISDLAFNEALMSWDRGHASQWGIVRAVLAAAAGGER